MPYTIAATGHRTIPAANIHLLSIVRQHLSKQSPDAAISGMALGWDMAFAEAALSLNIPLIAVIPFPQQPSRWPTDQIIRWRQIMNKASKRIVIAKEFSLDAFQQRNVWMVDHCDHLAAMFSGAKGGTANCIAYAKKQNKPVINLWSLL